MAAAVYLHNALFTHQSHSAPTTAPNRPIPDDDDPNEDEDGGGESSDSSSTSSDSSDSSTHHPLPFFDDSLRVDDLDVDVDTAAQQRSSSRISDGERHSLSKQDRQPQPQPLPVPTPAPPSSSSTRASNAHEHNRKSSEATLVPFSPARRTLPSDPNGRRPRNGTRDPDNKPAREPTQHPALVDAPSTDASEPPAQPSPPRDSLPPPGLPSTALSTSYTPLVPFPPAISSANPSNHTPYSRPKGRRRVPTPVETFGQILRRGRTPNLSLSRSTRTVILLSRLTLGIILCAWAGYCTVKYWLAYEEFRPSSSPSSAIIPEEDPPRSRYAFALAICCTVAVGLLALDLGGFLYFVLYPLELRPLQRTPTITPVIRTHYSTIQQQQQQQSQPPLPADTNVLPTRALSASIESTRLRSFNDPRPTTDPRASSLSRQEVEKESNPTQPPDNLQHPTTVSHIHSPVDSDPHRRSAYSTSEERSRSKRLSKVRPPNWVYPPLQIAPGTDGNEGPPHNDTILHQRQPEPARPVIDLADSPSPRSARATGGARDSVDATRPSSQYYSGDEAPSSPPQVERHDRATYKLHLPIACQQPSISPLPPPIDVNSLPPSGPQLTTAAVAPGLLSEPTTTAPPPRAKDREAPTRTAPRRVIKRKWTKTRRALHVVHWLAFIALNIPGFINVALVPIWYDPRPVTSGPNSTSFEGVNSPHRLAGICAWSPDVIWAGTALPPAYPPCTPKVSYRAWLWGAIGRVLITFFLSLLWIVLDGVWWGAWVVGTRNIGWRGSLPIPRRDWRPKRQPSSGADESHPEDTADESGHDAEGGLWKRIRVMSMTSKASKASAKSTRSGRSHGKEKARESTYSLPIHQPPPPVPPLDRSMVDLASPVGTNVNLAMMSPSSSMDALGGGTGSGGEGVSPSSPKPHGVRRKVVKYPTSSTSSFEPINPEQQPTPPTAHEMRSRRPSTHSTGDSTVIGSPLPQGYLPGSPSFSPAGSSVGHGAEGRDGAAIGRGFGLEMLPELEQHGSEPSSSQPQTRPPSRLGQYEDSNAGIRHSPPTPPTPPPGSYPPSSNQPSWTADMNALSPVTSPNADSELLGNPYFMVGDGGFSAGTNEGVYDEEGYYLTRRKDDPSRNREERPVSPLSNRSVSTNSYGEGHLTPLDVRVETPSHEGEEEEEAIADPRSTTPWFVHPRTSNNNNPLSPPPLVPAASQHPLASGIQLAMGHPVDRMDREVLILGAVVRRMSTIESFGSHERELESSRRGSAGTTRTNQTGRNVGSVRESIGGGGNGSGSGSASGSGNGYSGSRHSARHPGNSGSGSVEQSADKSTEEGFVTASSPTDLSPNTE